MFMRLSLLHGQSLKRVLQGSTPVMPPQGSPPGLPRAESAAPCLLSELCTSSISVSTRMLIGSLFTFNGELFRDRHWVLFSSVSQEPRARPAAGGTKGGLNGMKDPD